MPRLAGQQPQYIENQLLAFLEQRRHNPVMANVAHGITPDMFSALAKRMNALNPPPFGGAPTGEARINLVLAIVYAREPEHPSHVITEKPLAAPHG